MPDGPDITIGAQDFGESTILAEIYGQALESAGYPVSQQALGGFRDIVFASFESGDINFTARVRGVGARVPQRLRRRGDRRRRRDRRPAADPARTARARRASTPSPAVDSNSFVVTAETAEELGLENVSDLTADLTLGGPPDCPDNAFVHPRV